MKTLIVQFARLGDIYLSWPAARALKRIHGGEVHYLVRPRFKNALNGIGCVDKVLTLPTEELITPLISHDSFDLEKSLNCLDDLYEQLQNEKYDQIINMSFSPASSFFVNSIAGKDTKVMGYSRHTDGYVQLGDDVSRYFWAQVGPGLPNRMHLLDLFGGLAGVDYSIEDFRGPSLADAQLAKTIHDPYFVLHIGASESHKRLSPAAWQGMIAAYKDHNPKMKWVLVGPPEEKAIANEIERSFIKGHIINKVGQTRIEDLFGLLKFAEGLVGCDSVAMHMVPFVDQRAFCISVGNVKFWETGPMTLGSAVCEVKTPEAFNATAIANSIHQWTQGQFQNLIETVEEIPRFKLPKAETEAEIFAWNLLRGIYLSAPFPINSDFDFYKGCLRLFEANSVAIQNLNKRTKLKKEFLTSVLDRVDEIFLAVVQQVPALTPLFRWYQAEKTRIQPGTFDQIAQDTTVIHHVFGGLLKKYLLEEDVRKVEHDGNL